MSPLHIDLNADLGEIPAHLEDGTEEQLLQLVSSANIACGGHAGSPATMHAVVGLCVKHGVAVGAHPGYPDPAHFGRRSLALDPGALETTLRTQIEALDGIAQAAGRTLRHIKPHGALYNDAANNPELAACIARAAAPWKDSAVLVGLAGSAMLDLWAQRGFRVAPEAFADRRYEPGGSLRSRQFPDALIHDPAAAAAQAVALVTTQHTRAVDGTWIGIAARTLCVHGDTAEALAIARRIRSEFAAHSIGVEPL